MTGMTRNIDPNTIEYLQPGSMLCRKARTTQIVANYLDRISICDALKKPEA
jgi:hypothetical protein